MRLLTFLTLMVAVTTPAYAYVGPGAGLGAIATLVAVLLGFLLLIVGFVWFPLKRALKKRQLKNADTKEDNEDLKK